MRNLQNNKVSVTGLLKHMETDFQTQSWKNHSTELDIQIFSWYGKPQMNFLVNPVFVSKGTGKLAARAACDMTVTWEW